MKTAQSVILAVALALSVGLIAVNFMHMSSCGSDEDGSDQREEYLEVLNQRVLEAESMNLKNTLIVSRLVGMLSKQLNFLEQQHIAAINSHSQDEAILLALQLSAYPAPPIVEFELKAFIDDKTSLSNTVNAAMRDYGIDETQSSSSSKYDDDWMSNKKGGSKSSPKSRVDDFSPSDGDDKSDKPSLTEAEKLQQCYFWKSTYGVVVGATWGSLPLTLQREWVTIRCDYLLKSDSGEATI